MSDAAIICIAAAISVVAALVFLAVRYVTNTFDEAQRDASDASEAWKVALGDRTALARAEAKAMQLTFELARYKPKLPLKAPPEETSTASISPDTLRAIGRANGMELTLGTVADFGNDDPTHP